MSFFDDSLVISMCGGRGSGKTLMMAYLCMMSLLMGRKVYSNIDISFWCKQDASSPAYLYKSSPLNIESLMTLDEDLRMAVVAIDEVNLWADSHQWQAVSVQLIEAIFQQIRKRKLSFLLTVQDHSWLPKRLRWQTDLRIETFDLSYMYSSMERGAFFKQIWFDLSGKLSGYPYSEGTYDKSVKDTMFYGKPFWPVYDTLNEFGSESFMTKYKIHKTTKDIYADGSDFNIEGKKSQQAGELVSLEHFKSQLLTEGITEISPSEFTRKMLNSGIEITDFKLKSMLPKIGVEFAGSKGKPVYRLDREYNF